MAIIDIEWENQNALGNYPFNQTQPVNSVIVDACFQQFNGFIPTLNYIQVSSNEITLNITYDQGTSNFTFLESSYTSGLNYLRLAIGTRYIGRLTFGVGVTNLWNQNIGQQINYNLPFLATTVRSIKTNYGVFAINSLHGAVEFSNGTTDEAIFFNTATTNGRNSVTMSAVQNHAFLNNPPAQALLQLNLISPTDNNIFIASSDVLQINGTNIGGLNISLVGSFGINVFSNLTPIASTLGF